MKKNVFQLSFVLASLCVTAPGYAQSASFDDSGHQSENLLGNNDRIETMDFNQTASIGDDMLAEYRGTGLGGTILQVSTLSANLTNNTTNGGTTGNNAISDNALNNVAGVATFIQNSGNNVIIQNSMNLNVSLQ